MLTEVEIRCPSCRKVSIAAIPTPVDLACPRCDCSLAILAAIKSDAARLLLSARRSLLRGHHADALADASSSWDLRHTRAAASIAFIAATLAGYPLEGAAWLRSSRGPDLR